MIQSKSSIKLKTSKGDKITELRESSFQRSENYMLNVFRIPVVRNGIQSFFIRYFIEIRLDDNVCLVYSKP